MGLSEHQILFQVMAPVPWKSKRIVLHVNCPLAQEEERQGVNASVKYK